MGSNRKIQPLQVAVNIQPSRIYSILDDKQVVEEEEEYVENVLIIDGHAQQTTESEFVGEPVQQKEEQDDMFYT